MKMIHCVSVTSVIFWFKALALGSTTNLAKHQEKVPGVSGMSQHSLAHGSLSASIPFQKSAETVIKQDDFPEELSATWRSLLLEQSGRNVLFPSETDYLGVKLVKLGDN